MGLTFNTSSPVPTRPDSEAQDAKPAPPPPSLFAIPRNYAPAPPKSSPTSPSNRTSTESRLASGQTPESNLRGVVSTESERESVAVYGLTKYYGITAGGTVVVNGAWAVVEAKEERWAWMVGWLGFMYTGCIS